MITQNQFPLGDPVSANPKSISLGLTLIIVSVILVGGTLYYLHNSNKPNENLIDAINEHQWVKYLLYAGGAVIGVWLLGKTSKLLTDAIINFKSFNHAIKH